MSDYIWIKATIEMFLSININISEYTKTQAKNHQDDKSTCVSAQQRGYSPFLAWSPVIHQLSTQSQSRRD